MINMMYLVLTALLALNVSKEILDSFITVNNGLENTKSSLKEKVDGTYDTFASMAKENEAKYGKAWASAQEVRRQASELVTYIDSVKVRVITQAEHWPVEKVIGKDAGGKDTVINMEFLTKKDSHDEITNLMVGSEPGKPKDGPMTANELRTKLETFRDLVKEVGRDNPALVASADRIFNFEDRRDASGTMNNWQSINFYHVPLVAGITIMSKVQSDVRSLENEMVTKLLGDVESKSFKFSALQAMVQPQSSYVTAGGKFRSKIFLGAYDPNNQFSVEVAKNGTIDSVNAQVIGDKEVFQSDASGKFEYVADATGAGEKTYAGIIIFKPVGGTEQRIPFRDKYEVAAPNLVVSPTKMNVFYRGVDNPVDISVAGYSAKDIVPSMTNGSLTKAAQGYIVKPGKDAEATVNVTVTNADGSKKPMPGVKFRVKNVPNPTPYFAGKSLNDETVKKTELTAAQGVIAKMENFEFDLKFEVVEYKISTTINGNYLEKLCKGAALTGEAKEVLQKVKSGQKVYVEGIKARGPDGTVRALGALSFKVI
ncbi:MAG: gliding motility protein GldM [Bacteroidetes bacterium]|nr:gliding motility protein GldM [Bacteroidota bacterium]